MSTWISTRRTITDASWPLTAALALGLVGLGGCGDDDGGNNNSPPPDASSQDGATLDASLLDASSPDAAVPTCETACTLIQSCTDLPDRELLFGTTQQSCVTACEGSVEPYLRDCLLRATVCGQAGECTRCLTASDVGFCRDLVCDFLVDDCGGTDVNQCYIDCEMYGSGAAGCFRGAGRICWVSAANHQDCTAAALCPTIH